LFVDYTTQDLFVGGSSLGTHHKLISSLMIECNLVQVDYSRVFLPA